MKNWLFIYKALFGHVVATLVMLGLVGCGGGTSTSTNNALTDSLSHRAQLQPIPTDASRQGVQLHPGISVESNWKVFREWPHGQIRIFSREKNGWIELSFIGGNTALARLVLESDDALYLLTYDVETNVPSGRGLQAPREGIDLWRVDRSSNKSSLVAKGLPLGGVDNLIVARAHSNVVDMCTINLCLRVTPNGEIEKWAASIPDGFEIVDLRFASEGAYALVRRSPDHTTGNPQYTLPPYLVVTLPNPGSTALPMQQKVEDKCLPFRLEWTVERPKWSCAKGAVELAEVFKSDLARIPHNGVGDIGLDNSEGRIAWSLVYSLNALVHLDKLHTPRLTSAADWQIERKMLGDALDLVARQGTTNTIGYASRRYSQNRNPLLFALHLGRISQLLAAGEATGLGTLETKKALKSLQNQMLMLDETAEVPFQYGSYTTLAYRKGIDFWADGANVPYNYVSGYVHGLVSSGNLSTQHIERAVNLLQPLLTIEDLAQGEQWHYWWGLGSNGWSVYDAVSANTPAYAGSKGLAHITYRTMDAMAVLSLASIMPTSVDMQVIQNIRNLVASGRLLQFVNQDLVQLGGVQKINLNVAMYYARSASPWELQSQLFALEALAE